MKRRGNREGSIYKRKDGRWCGQLILGYDLKTGKPIKKYIYARTREEVAKKLNRLLWQAGNVSPEKYTLGGWLHTWLELYKKSSLRPTTFERYESIIKNHVPETLKKLPLEKLYPEHLQRLYLEKQKEGLSGRSVELLHVVLHSALKQAMRLGYVSRNVADYVDRPKKKTKEKRILTQEELHCFLSCANKHRLYPAFLLLVTTGIRRGEVLGLRWQDLNYEEETIVINQSLTTLNHGFVIQEPKSESGKRIIPLLPEVVEELKKWRKKWLEEKISLGPDWPETDLVFPSEVHTPMYPRNFTRVFYTICQKAGIEGITIHSLRHSFVSYLVAQGVDPRTVKELVGHSSVTLTLDVYARSISASKKEAIEHLRNVIND